MKSSPLSRSLFFGSAAAFLALVTSASAADIILQKVPALTLQQAPEYPDNLARFQLGARIESLDTKTGAASSAESALLSDDPTVNYSLGQGSTTILVSLPRIENIDSIAFKNSGAQGEVTVATSNAKLPADSPQWQTAGRQTLAQNNQIHVGPNEAKYVRLTFTAAQAGHISGFGIYSTPAASDFTAPRPRNVSRDQAMIMPISYNLTDLHVKARALYVSSGRDLALANNMIDDQSATAFAFADNDPTPTAIIDLGRVSTLRRLSTSYSPRKGSVSFFVLQTLPSANTTTVQNLPATLRLDENFLANLKPVGTVSDDAGDGRVSVDFPEIAGRYVMVRWTSAESDNQTFAVNEVAAFGGTQAGLLAANNNVALVRNNADEKDLGDAKDAKDIPAEGPPQPPSEGPPPNLPQPPPFTFIPQIIPASP